MDIRILEDNLENKNIWTEYVLKHPDTTVDHCWEWRWILEGAFKFKPYYVAAFDADRLVGILPLFHVPRGFGRSALVSIPFGNYGGICADSEEVSELILGEAKRLLNELKCLYVALNHRTALESKELQSVDDRARYSMPIHGSLESISANLKQTVRRYLRKSVKEGVTVEESRDTGPAYKIHLDKFRSLGTPCFPRSYFDLTLKYFGDRATIHYVQYQGKTIGFHTILFFKKSLVVPVIGTLEYYMKLYPSYILNWHAIEVAVARGLSEFDLCRSRRNSGPANHKLFFGMTEYPLTYQYLHSDKHKVLPRSTADSKYKIAGRLWRRIPLGITEIIGPKVVRYFA